MPYNNFFQPPQPTTGGRQSLRPEYGGTRNISKTNRLMRITAEVEQAHDKALYIAFKARRAEGQAERRRASR